MNKYFITLGEMNVDNIIVSYTYAERIINHTDLDEMIINLSTVYTSYSMDVGFCIAIEQVNRENQFAVEETRILYK